MPDSRQQRRVMERALGKNASTFTLHPSGLNRAQRQKYLREERLVQRAAKRKVKAVQHDEEAQG